MYQVMIVDDEPMAASLIVNIIKRKYSNFDIMGTAYDGEEALELMEKKGEPDVLITDIQMPVMNGLKLVEETKKRYPEVLSVIVSGYQEFEYAKQAIAFGVCDYILKPIVPSEFAKLAVIMFLASLISRMPKKMAKFSMVIRVMLVIIPLFGLIAYNNLSTAIIVLGIGVAMVFVSSPKYLQFFAVGGVGVGAIALFLLLPSAGYRSDRIAMWQHPENFEKGFQTLQGLYAIGSGGLFGKGLGNSMQKLGFVPEAPNDMIFSIICEELGLFGAICVILLFLLLMWRFMVIANNARDLYGALLMTGILAHIAIQVVLNIAVVTNSIPNTGVTLPFISYGGTSVVFLMAEMGLALSVSRGIQFEPDASEIAYD